MTDADAWTDALDPGERLLWSGRPATGLRFRLSDLGPTGVGAIFTVFSVVWVTTAAGGGGPAVLPWLGLVPLAIGLHLIAGRKLLEARRRARTAYALTDARALIREGGRLRKIPLATLDEPEIRTGPETTIVLFTESLLGQRFRSGPVEPGHRREKPANPREVGFEYIADGERVAGLLLDARRAAQTR